MGYSPQSGKKSDITEATEHACTVSCDWEHKCFLDPLNSQNVFNSVWGLSVRHLKFFYWSTVDSQDMEATQMLINRGMDIPLGI